jgi:hypothetical protein
VQSNKTVNLSRRAVLQAGIAVAGAAGLAGQARAQDEKIAKELVLYQDTPNNGQECDICEHFEPPNGCKLVAGEISPKGWCGVFAAKA